LALSTAPILNLVRRINASLRGFVRRLFEIGSKQTIFYKPFQSAGPRVVGITSHIRAHGHDYITVANIAHINADVYYQVRNLLHRARDREAGAELFGEIGIASPAGLKVAASGLRLDRAYIGDLETSRLGQCFAQLLAKPQQALILGFSGSVNLAVQAVVDEFEVENGNARQGAGVSGAAQE
jgi:hypothetical protein